MLLVEKHENWLTDEKAYLSFDEAPAEESTAKMIHFRVDQGDVIITKDFATPQDNGVPAVVAAI